MQNRNQPYRRGFSRLSLFLQFHPVHVSCSWNSSHPSGTFMRVKPWEQPKENSTYTASYYTIIITASKNKTYPGKLISSTNSPWRSNMMTDRFVLKEISHIKLQQQMYHPQMQHPCLNSLFMNGNFKQISVDSHYFVI